ncbi:hypothetical protein CF392_08790 [Tamilnaduibacter salinus]|uniref:Glycosyl transferase family 8 n=1 Tax=Tamilnaduibacter salinus TaxID=1484056 RepID=A0A2A2I455_9GAMM|nr:DUF6492 family protein [Tamilnaduibacter salinus]PAV25880.1 hypothetical protein CF392_08790 [Tamilnaduibacter salinus]
MPSKDRYCIVTPTWSGDLDHFRLLRRSLARSRFAETPHYVVVQTEDREAFEEFNQPPVRLRTTAEVLPASVERRRRRATALSKRLGRHWTRICGSLNRVWGWPRWPAYTGWHTQQICKLMVAKTADVDRVIVLDSDVIVTPHATPADFDGEGRYRCFATWEATDSLGSKVSNWVQQSEKLIGQAAVIDGQANTYFDTPFILETPVVRAMIEWLESTYGRPWWARLLAQPPRRWSEFGTYKAFLATHYDAAQVDWCSPEVCRYLYDASDVAALIGGVRQMLGDESVHYLTIHSQSNGREDWGAWQFADQLADVIGEPR